LLITIVLLAFLVMILTSLAMVSRVETQIATTSRSAATARGNALMALNVAIGQLQQVAGPDLRLTARANLQSAGKNAHFTGVWSPGAASPMTWLVSGNQVSSSPLAVTPLSVPDPAGINGADEVFLVGDNSVAVESERVKLKRQAITVPESAVPGMGPGSSTPAVVGHFAYWVGDEGTKASVGLHDQTDELDYDNTLITPTPSNPPTSGVNWDEETELRAQLRQLAPVHPNRARMFADYEEAADTNAQIKNIVDYSQMRLVNAGGLGVAELRERFHDATPVSRAVLVDHTVVPNGGLRQDLSDSPDVFPSAIRNFVKERASSRNGLQSFHAQKQSESGTDTAFPMFSKGPVLTEFLIRFQFYRNGSNGNVRIKYEVQFELWNPYACTLNGASDLRIRLSNLPIVTVTNSLDASSYNVDLNTAASLFGRVEPSISWAPGQVRWFKGAGGSGNFSPTGAARNTEITGTPVPAGCELRIAIPAVSAGAPFTVELRQGTSLSLATYRPPVDFVAGNATNSSPSLDSTGWHFGFGWDLKNDIREWTDPTRATSQDPRRTNLAGDFNESADSAWSTQPVDNIGDINQAGLDTFNATATLALFDLPDQEQISVGALQHVIGEKPYRIGNPTVAPLTSVNDYFDRYFFSTLPRWHAWSPTAPPLLPNRYVEVYVPNPAAPPAVGDRYGANTAAADYMLDRTHAAKYLLLRGAFNINSTSEPAWRAVLAGLQLKGWTYGGATPQAGVDLENAFFRLPNGAQGLPTNPVEPPAEDNTFVRGALTATHAQIEAMAASIVSQLKTRGRPYATLQSFVDDGVITQAVADAGINSADPALVPPYSPGWLSQADVLAAIGPFITPRSDTFRVRAYGDASNPITGATEGRAWCEAVVQRVPDLTAPVSGSTLPTTDPLAPPAAKYPFGRQFKIISFRWLSSDQI
jgi:hypothetical protein